MDLQQTARQALACLDLTSLNDGDTQADIARLCARADGPHGRVAAVCVWPRWAAFARANLAPAIAVAAVANFPDGGTDVERALRDTGQIVQSGAQEVDLVLPYRALHGGDERACTAVLDAVRRECTGLKLKVILESGELRDAQTIARAAHLALDAGADFLKTSTGRSSVGATPQAAQVMLQAIADRGAHAHAGFKVSGGVRTLSDAAVYIELVVKFLGAAAVTPARFRIGASALLDDIEAVLTGGQSNDARRSAN
jgi:deoxyribose-phosphate aldolase